MIARDESSVTRPLMTSGVFSCAAITAGARINKSETQGAGSSLITDWTTTDPIPFTDQELTPNFLDLRERDRTLSLAADDLSASITTPSGYLPPTWALR